LISNNFQDKLIDSKILLLCVASIGFLMNQSYVAFGANLSLADFILIIVFIVLIAMGRLVLPLRPIIFFVIISILVLSTTTFFVPIKFSFNPELSGVLKSYLKLVACLLYFIIGVNLSRLGLIKKVLKWFSIGALIVGSIAIAFAMLNIGLFSDGFIRLKGFMNDPNYFAILQIVAMAYFVGVSGMRKRYRYIFLIILAVSMLMSGSSQPALNWIIQQPIFKRSSLEKVKSVCCIYYFYIF